MDMAWYHLCLSWKARLQGDLETSLHYANLCNDLLGANAMLYGKIFALVGLTQIHHDRRENAAAMGYFAHLRRLTTKSNSNLLEFVCLMLEAQISLDQSQEEGISLLSKAMAIGSRYGIVSFLWWLPDVMTQLCLKALEAGIEVDYVRHLILRRRLYAKEPPLHLENWPWPLKIYTMGRFLLVIDGKPVIFSGKVQEKPLALLKTIIAMGGREVDEKKLFDLLWPTSDGDAAYRSYATNLHRLRKLLGHDQALLVQGGRVTLNSKVVWTDALAFDEIISARRLTGQPDRIMEKAMALYAGHFLNEEDDALWAVSMRERLRGKVLRVVTEAGGRLEKAGEWDKAIDCYQKGVECDDMMEEYYQRLMVCHGRLGRRGNAISIYRRCQRVLATLGIRPSAATQAVYAEVTANTET
jgi:DNA-binding SARP family transcriptional activator